MVLDRHTPTPCTGPSTQVAVDNVRAPDPGRLDSLAAANHRYSESSIFAAALRLTATSHRIEGIDFGRQ